MTHFNKFGSWVLTSFFSHNWALCRRILKYLLNKLSSVCFSPRLDVIPQSKLLENHLHCWIMYPFHWITVTELKIMQVCTSVMQWLPTTSPGGVYFDQQQVLCTLFTGHNHLFLFFDTKTTFSINFRQKCKKMRKITKNMIFCSMSDKKS